MAGGGDTGGATLVKVGEDEESVINAPAGSQGTASEEIVSAGPAGIRLPTDERLAVIPVPPREDEGGDMARRFTCSVAGLDAGDLGSLEADAGHQAFLIEDIGVGAAVEGSRGQGGGFAAVDDDEVGAAADLPAGGPVEVGDVGGTHEEQGVAVLLHAGLHAIGSSRALIVAAGLAVAAQEHTVARLRAHDESAFRDLREDQHPGGGAAEAAGGRLLGVEVLQGGACVARDLAGAGLRGIRLGDGIVRALGDEGGGREGQSQAADGWNGCLHGNG